jgi:hypothetical protein
VEFEPTIAVFERVKTVHVLDRAATVTGTNFSSSSVEKSSVVMEAIEVMGFVYETRYEEG